MKAPMTGPIVSPKLKEASHQACFGCTQCSFHVYFGFTLTVAFLSGNLAIKMERFEVHVAAAPTPFDKSFLSIPLTIKEFLGESQDHQQMQMETSRKRMR